jgi:hypothetical protein
MPLSPLGERVGHPGVFFSRGGPGLRPPKGYGCSGRTARYGPQAGVPGKLPFVKNYAGQDAKQGPRIPQARDGGPPYLSSSDLRFPTRSKSAE